MRVRRSIVVVIAALVIWTAVSFWILALTVGTGPCPLLVTVPPGGFPDGAFPTLTQDEMDTMTAGCSQPSVGDLMIPAIGYIVIVGLGVASATAGKREVGIDP